MTRGVSCAPAPKVAGFMCALRRRRWSGRRRAGEFHVGTDIMPRAGAADPCRCRNQFLVIGGESETSHVNPFHY